MAPLRSLGNPDISPFDDVFCATGGNAYNVPYLTSYNKAVDFDGSDDGSRMTQAELGAAQRRPDEDGKRLSQKDRMSVRRLFALERQAEQIVDSLKSVSEFGFARTQRRGGGAGEKTEEPNKDRGSSR